MTRIERWLRERLNPWSTGLARRWHGGWRRPGTASSSSVPAPSDRPAVTFVRLEPSPGAWQVPAGERPGWSWVPPQGARPMVRRMPTWARLWYMTPLIDRFAYEWMWWHGYWGIPVDPQNPLPDGGVREPRRPHNPQSDLGACVDAAVSPRPGDHACWR